MARPSVQFSTEKASAGGPDASGGAGDAGGVLLMDPSIGDLGLIDRPSRPLLA
jgi:hypothetical protein